ncbi:hypothetical protein [Cellulomonas xylanilytica]|uniref:hypothetical protein n=1 Tax=Cellulomonas xylanilytica TaxID=233583 RepID=UPI0011BE691C|nr:hypothetical protein [Cellulomonas xylanilytica]
MAFHEEVVRFLDGARIDVQVPSGPWAALITDGEVGYAVSLDGTVLVAEWRSRGALSGVRIRTPRLDVLERFVVMTFASDWRGLNGLPRISTWGGPAFTPEGVSVVPHDGAFAVTVVGEPEPVAWGMKEVEAARLARVVTAPLAEITTSIMQADGGPLFREDRSI